MLWDLFLSMNTIENEPHRIKNLTFQQYYMRVLILWELIYYRGSIENLLLLNLDSPFNKNL